MCRFARTRWTVVHVAALVLVLSCRPAEAHETGAYLHDDSIDYSNPDWMSALPGALRLSELAVPGTHDSMALHGGDIAQCQSLSLADQLDAGIRALDIRCRHIEDVFAIHHGPIFQEAFFGGDVLQVCQDFLAAHPGETILMRVKKEHTEEDVTRSFAETFAAYRDEHPGLMWDPPEDETNPRLDAVRGKIVILQDFDGEGTRYGLSWDDEDQTDIQDDYFLGSIGELHDKWDKVKDQLNDANGTTTSKRFVNFLSGSGGAVIVLPYFVASGHSNPATGAPRLPTGHTTATCDSDCYPDFPRVDCLGDLCTVAYEGTNVLAEAYIRSHGLTRVGSVMADFPGADLIDTVIALNPWNYPPDAVATAPAEVDEGSPVAFDASGSSDRDGDVLTFQWDFEDDGVYDAVGATAFFTWGDDQTITARVLVSDGKSTNEATVTVLIRNVAPAATIDAVTPPSPDAVLPFQTIDFQGSFVDPGWLDVHTGTWDFADGTGAFPAVIAEDNDEPASTGETAISHAFAEPGVYPVTLTVLDDDGGSSSTTHDLRIDSAQDALRRMIAIIRALPPSAFRRGNTGYADPLAKKITNVIERIDRARYLSAARKLRHDVLRKMDGSVGGHPQNDWIVDPVAQARLRRILDDVIAWLNRKGLNGPFDPNTLRLTKLDVSEALTGLLPTGSPQDDLWITRAVPHVERSLLPSLWASETTLTSQGRRVFEEEREAARALMRVVDPDVAPLLALLVDVDRVLAKSAIIGATAAGGDPRELAKAQASYDRGLLLLAQNRPDAAIDEFGKAWSSAQSSRR